MVIGVRTKAEEPAGGEIVMKLAARQPKRKSEPDSATWAAR